MVRNAAHESCESESGRASTKDPVVPAWHSDPVLRPPTSSTGSKSPSPRNRATGAVHFERTAPFPFSSFSFVWRTCRFDVAPTLFDEARITGGCSFRSAIGARCASETAQPLDGRTKILLRGLEHGIGRSGRGRAGVTRRSHQHRLEQHGSRHRAEQRERHHLPHARHAGIT